MSIKTRNARVALIASTVAVALTVAGCAASSKKQAGAPSGSAGSASSALGTANPADSSKSPVLVGFISQDHGAVGAFPEGTQGAKAAVSYINDYLGGVSGHPLKLDPCATDGTLASDQSCAQQMVTDKVLYVQSAISFNSYAWPAILGPAGVPVIGFNPFTPQEYSAKNFYAFGGLPLQAATLADVISKQPNVKTVSIVTGTVPGALAIVPVIQKALRGLGINADNVVKFDVSNTNLLATYVAAKKNADGIIANLSTPNCISFANAAASQGNKLPVAFNGTCLDPGALKQVGSKMDGWFNAVGLQDPDGSDPEAKIFISALDKYAPTAGHTSYSQAAFSNVMTVYNNVLKPLGPDNLSAASIEKQITTPGGGQVFMGPKYTCPGKVLSAICTSSDAVIQIKDSKPTWQSGFTDSSAPFAAALK